MISGEKEGYKCAVSRQCTWKDSFDDGLVFGKPNGGDLDYYYYYYYIFRNRENEE